MARDLNTTFRASPFYKKVGARMLSQTTHLRRIFPLIFHTASTLSAPSGHLPLEGKAVCRGYRFPPPTSAPSGHLLPKEGGSIHASPFPWKGLPSAARRGWLPFLRRSRLLFAFPSRRRRNEGADGALAAGKCARECVSSRRFTAAPERLFL